MTSSNLPQLRPALVLLLLAALSVVSCKKKTTPPAQRHPLAVRVIHARSGPITQSVRYIGTIHSRNEIKVLSRVAGKLSDLPVKEGEHVKVGANIAVIAAPEMGARISRVRADVTRAKEESSFACQQAKNDESLAASGAISPLKLDASRQKCRSSQAAVRAATAGLSELRIMAGNTLERAPFTGTVLRWLAEPGENVMPGRPILLYGDAPLEVRVNVSEKDIRAGIAVGTSVILRPEGGKPVRAKVSFVAPMAVGPGRVQEVDIPLSSEDTHGLSHGQSIDVAFIAAEEPKAISVPREAVLQTNKGAGVFVVDKDVARWRPVKLSAREDGWVAVSGQVNASSAVVVGNLEAVRDNLPVYPVASTTRTP